MNKLAWLLIPLTIGWIVLGAWYMATSPCTPAAAPPPKEAKAATAAPVAPAKKAVWTVTDNKFKASSTEHFTFPTSNFGANVPAPTKTAFQSVATHLKKNSNRLLVLTGRYDATEKNTSSFGNLGIARAEDIKSRLVKMGAPAANISTNGLEENNIKFRNNLLFNGVNFAFRGKSAAALNKLATTLRAKPLNVYFATGESRILFDDDLRKYFQDLKYYIDNTPDAMIQVTGHTDNVGNPAANTRLGASRAKFMADYMARQGFKLNQINTSSEGPNQPIADNATDEGRAKNRRVEIILK